MPAIAQPLDVRTAIRLLSLAIGSAVASLLLMAALWLATFGLPQPVAVALICWFFVAHGWFIAFIADQGLRLRLDPAGAAVPRSMAIAAKGAVPLALPLAAAAAACWWSGDLRWSLLGWVVPVATALPARITCRLREEGISLAPLAARIVPALLAFVLVLIPGWPLLACRGECFGMMEGGIIAFPLAGAYLFVASTTAALLSVMAVRTISPRP